MSDPIDPQVVPRVALLFVLQLFVTPVVFLILRWRAMTLFIMLLVTSLVALTTSADTPPLSMASAVFAAVLLPFIASLFGLVLGFAVSAVFDHFKADEEALKRAGGDGSSYVNVQRVAMLVAALVLVGAYIVVVAVPRSALVACIIAHLAVAILVFGTMVLVSRRTPQMRHAWIAYGILYVVAFAIIAFTLAFSDSFFWTFFVIVLVYALALICMLLLVLIFSNDTKAALVAVASDNNSSTMASSPSVLPSFPSPPVAATGNGYTSASNNTIPTTGNTGNGAAPDLGIFKFWNTEQ